MIDGIEDEMEKRHEMKRSKKIVEEKTTTTTTTTNVGEEEEEKLGMRDEKMTMDVMVLLKYHFPFEPRY